jgi:hypothetical protein
MNQNSQKTNSQKQNSEISEPGQCQKISGIIHGQFSPAFQSERAGFTVKEQTAGLQAFRTSQLASRPGAAHDARSIR